MDSADLGSRGAAQALTWARRAAGPLLTLAVVAVLELTGPFFRIPNPPAFLLLTVVFSAFTGGVAAGLISAGIAWLYVAYFFSIPGRPFQYTEENLRRVAVWAACTPTMAGLVGLLKRRVEREVGGRQRAEHALHEIQEEMIRNERLTTLGQLAGGVSHELRHPLAVIKNSVYYLRMILPKDDERAVKHLVILEREVESANRIISGLLEFGSVTPPVWTPTSLGELARELLDTRALPDGVELEVDLPERLPVVWVDADQVKLIVDHLVTNAVQAMPAGGRLTVAAARVIGGVAITVTDTGIGIPAENLDKVFQPLFTTKAKGIGLGLALSRRLAEANEGALSVERSPGGGSRFTARFSRVMA